MAVMNTRRPTRLAAKSPLTRAAKVTKPTPKIGPKGQTAATTKQPTKPKRARKAASAPATRVSAPAKSTKAELQQSKQRWETYVTSSTRPESERLSSATFERSDCATQTECTKLYGLKPAELTSLDYFEAKGAYGKTVKLFLKVKARDLAVRKLGMLAGEVGDESIVKKGEEVWREKFGGVDVGTVNEVDAQAVQTGGAVGPAARTRAQIKAGGVELSEGL